MRESVKLLIENLNANCMKEYKINVIYTFVEGHAFMICMAMYYMAKYTFMPVKAICQDDFNTFS